MGRTLIVGAGPTGLGAAWRLDELGDQTWTLIEGADQPGGLAASFVDDNGFTWDVGGHVQFSHYEYFDRAMDTFLGRDGWLHHEREAWVWMRDRFIPYPMQNNIRHLPPDDLYICLTGLLETGTREKRRDQNFREWINGTYGKGLADVFMLPYNKKVWAYPPECLNAKWVGERVAPIDVKQVLHNIVFAKDDIAWGPNNKFRFPVRGGTGAIWRACAERLPQEKLIYKNMVTGIDLQRRTVTTETGAVMNYDRLISTIPLSALVCLSKQVQFGDSVRRGLLHSSSNICGIGLRGRTPEHLKTKCWMYFPEDDCPFYRVTVFSNYSPNNVPNGDRNWSLMAEVSESPYRPVDKAALADKVISGLLATRLIERREDIVSFWHYRADYGYPTPGLQRDTVLAEIIPFFERHDVFPRGRFGSWKYEVSNQDHSFMQGVELIDRLINGQAEFTVVDPDYANSRKHRWPIEIRARSTGFE